MKLFKAIVICLTISSSLAEAANVTQTNRYATVANKPLAAQINPLLTVQQMHFPQQVVSVGDAIRYWMQYSGYKMANDAQLPSTFKNLMGQPLPQVQRNLGPLTIKDGLKVLAGIDVFTLIQNPLTRTITFRFSPVRGHSS